MFRAASRFSHRALLSATVAGTSVGVQETREKLSIYSPPAQDTLLVHSPSSLEREIGVVRRQIVKTYGDTRAYVQSWVSKWIGVEHAVEYRIKSIISPHEAMTPGLLYIGVSTLTGSILARNRILLTRLMLPPIFLLVSANHFLPKTTGNLTGYLGELEDRYFPAFSHMHGTANAHTQMTWEKIKEATKTGREQLNYGAVVAVEKLQEVSGLKLKESLGWRKSKVQQLENSATEVKSALERKVEEAETKVEQKVDEVKRSV